MIGLLCVNLLFVILAVKFTRTIWRFVSEFA